MSDSSMSSTGVSTQHAESEKRFMETINAKPSEAILFRAATQQQVLSAIAEEELARISANIILAKQGLYDPDSTDTIFHVANVITLSIDGTYKIQRSVIDGVLAHLQEQPELMYVK